MIKEKLANWQHLSLKKRLGLSLGLVSLLAVLTVGGTIYAVRVRPQLGSQMAEVLRKTIGDEAVANLEAFVFAAQDNFRKIQYQVTGQQATSPWSLTPVPTPIVIALPTLIPPTLDPSSLVTPTPTPPPKPLELKGVSWPPPNAVRMGSLDDEGVWTPYLYDASGRVVAYRTFLQPDKERPFAVTAIVIFNLSVTRLNFVLGTEEPVSTVKVYRPGAIPFEDRQPNTLLAMFNGGFKTQHGQYGVLYDYTLLLAPRPNIGTLAIYHDGRVSITPWDATLNDTKLVKAWRQNGPLLLERNVINPEATDKNKLLDNWGGNFGHVVGEDIATWRSGIGLSENKRFMYYVAGPSLTVYTLANVFKQVGGSDAVQLDINPYWVHFTSVTFVNKQPKTDPLFPEMRDNQDRYLGSFTRDYFYVTAHNVDP